MAGAEVTVSSGELMKEEQQQQQSELGGNNRKTPVILHLQPFLHGINVGTADTGTTVLAVETHHDDSKEDGDEVQYGYPITCGESKAVLLYKKFVCPGINVRCVKFNEQLISPKQFVHLAGKATLKDWKRAIRLGGVMLRKMMDSGQIDFYQHNAVCSNTCRSTKFDVLISSTRLPQGTSAQPGMSGVSFDPVGGHTPPLTGDSQIAEEVEEPLEDKFSATTEWSFASQRLLHPFAPNGHFTKRKMEDTPDGVLSLWKCVAGSGLMGEVLSSLQTELLTTLKGVELRSERANLQEADAIILNSLCEMFGLLDSVKQAVDLSRSQNEEREIHNSVYELDEILENQRKLSCDKGTSYKSFIKHIPNERKTNSHAQNSASSAKASAVIQPLSVGAVPATSYTQFFSHFAALTGQRHLAGIGRTDGNSSSVVRKHKSNEARKQEKLQRLRQQDNGTEDTSGIHKRPRQRTFKLQGDTQISNDVVETEHLDDIETVIIERQSSKKHKSK
ncbi:glucocorticoid modulatory element-binding protein 1-like isoform X2 [Gouania willdenowi]|uniref:Glucocorticoid modulatory element-binding protein 1-like n=2 Tax=Gouania willdenowi TaxID=441366 RepID=A0A8C5DYM7_GOUWI|nr:glucocorticoid modulatory element-binding protein 1-like isoform X2 [Gouania willdenowi]